MHDRAALGNPAASAVIFVDWRDCRLQKRRLARSCRTGSQLEDTGRVRLLSAVGFDATDAPSVLPFRPIARVVSDTVSVGSNDDHGNVFRPCPSSSLMD